MTDYASLSRAFAGAAEAANQAVTLRFAGCHIGVRCNDPRLIAELQNYFAGYVDRRDHHDIELLLLGAPVPEPPVELSPWPRPPGKPAKEAFADFSNARLIQKVRTGLLFLQGINQGLAIGPLTENFNQVVNFINNQTINRWKREGWEICHAAALAGSGGLVAFAGFSGGGKSTLMLHLMNQGPYRFISNDRLLIKREDGAVMARGVAKMPRVNPGTLLNNPALVNLLPEARRAALQSLSEDELWSLEEKYDAPMAELFGPERIAEQGVLAAAVILDWTRGDTGVTRLEACELSASAGLLEALMKSPGPFYADADGHFLTDEVEPEPRPYLETLAGVPIYRISGEVDFPAAVSACRPLLEG